MEGLLKEVRQKLCQPAGGGQREGKAFQLNPETEDMVKQRHRRKK